MSQSEPIVDPRPTAGLVLLGSYATALLLVVAIFQVNVARGAIFGAIGDVGLAFSLGLGISVKLGYLIIAVRDRQATEDGYWTDIFYIVGGLLVAVWTCVK
jgi:hypothetical protein